MNLHTLLADRIANEGLCPGALTVEAWLGSTWIRFPIGTRAIPLIPLWGLKRAHLAHDVHHVLLGYPTTMRGEYELAAWELASGGCAWNGFFWIDRIGLAAMGLLLHRKATLRAAARGRRHRNLYGNRIAAPFSELLAMDEEQLRREMRL